MESEPIYSTNVESFENCFLTNSPVSHDKFQAALEAVQSMLLEKFAKLEQPYSGKPILD